MSKRFRLAAFFAVLGVIVAIGAVVTIADRPSTANADGHPSNYAVTAGQDGCGAGWGTGSTPRLPGGDQTSTVTNGTVAGMEVYLQAVGTKKVYLDLEGIGSGAHTTAQVTLGSGRYRFVCLPADADPVDGPTVTVGPAPAAAQLTPGIVPVTRNELIPVAKAYGGWVASRIPVLRQQVGALARDASAGERSAAKRDWLTAHQTYETLGAAYGAFGDLDKAIDGNPAPGRTAETDPGMTGFHRVEAELWSGAAAADVSSAVNALAAAVDKLGATFTDAEIDPKDIGLRAHEIIENAIQFELTGSTDAGSSTELATIDANLAGAAQALRPLTGILRSRYDKLGATTASLAAATALIETYRQTDGSWAPLTQLTRSDRERIDARLDATVELLAPVAAICDIRREA